MARTGDPSKDGILGIDPGLSGGLAYISNDMMYVKIKPMPVLKGGLQGIGDKSDVSVEGILDFISELAEDGKEVSTVVIEVVHAMPKQGVTSTFNFGKGFGLTIGCLQARGFPIMFVRPTVWKKEVLRDTERDKAAAIQFCLARFPKMNLLATPRSKVPHDGMADAVCLAVYGRRFEGLENGEVSSVSRRRARRTTDL